MIFLPALSWGRSLGRSLGRLFAVGALPSYARLAALSMPAAFLMSVMSVETSPKAISMEIIPFEKSPMPSMIIAEMVVQEKHIGGPTRSNPDVERTPISGNIPTSDRIIILNHRHGFRYGFGLFHFRDRRPWCDSHWRGIHRNRCNPHLNRTDSHHRRSKTQTDDGDSINGAPGDKQQANRRQNRPFSHFHIFPFKAKLKI